MENDDPKPTVDRIRSTLKLYPYVAGGHGTSIATLLSGEVRPGKPSRAEDNIRRSERHGDQHHPAVRVRVLRHGQRVVRRSRQRPPTRRSSASSRPSASSRGSRSHPTTGCAASSPRRPPSERHLAGALMFGSSVRGGIRVLPGVFVAGQSLRRRLQLRDTAPARHREGITAFPPTAPASCTPDRVLLRLHRNHPSDVHASDRRRLPVRDRLQGLKKDLLDGARIIE